jgi:hypothetical protein
MHLGDLLVLEVRLKAAGAKAAEVESVGAKRFDFGPLEYYLGARFEEAEIDSVLDDDLSDVDGTETTVIRCTKGHYDGKSLAGVQLVYIHQYAADAFLQFIEKAGFDVLLHEVSADKTFLECVVRLRRDQPSGSVTIK